VNILLSEMLLLKTSANPQQILFLSETLHTGLRYIVSTYSEVWQEMLETYGNHGTRSKWLLFIEPPGIMDRQSDICSYYFDSS